MKRSICKGLFEVGILLIALSGMAVTGPTETRALALAKAFQMRCPVYTTLSRARPSS